MNIKLQQAGQINYRESHYHEFIVDKRSRFIRLNEIFSAASEDGDLYSHALPPAGFGKILLRIISEQSRQNCRSLLT